MTRMTCRFVFTVALLAAMIVLPAAAQTSAPPAPLPEISKLAFFAGDWNCKGRAEASPLGPAHATVGRVQVHKEMGGFWYVGRYSETKTAENPQPIVFQFVEGYDSAAKTFTLDCFDSFGSDCHQTSAGWQDNKLVYSGESTGGGPATPVRDTFTKTGDAGLEHTGEMQIEGKWVALDHESCTRAKK